MREDCYEDLKRKDEQIDELKLQIKELKLVNFDLRDKLMELEHKS